MEWAVYRTDPSHAPAQASTRAPRQINMASCGRQPQVSPLSPTGVQAVLPTSGRVARYLACSSGPQSGGVYHLYQELLRPSLYLKNSCTNLRRHPGRFLPCLLPLSPLLHIIDVVFMTFFGLVIDCRAPAIAVLGLLLKC